MQDILLVSNSPGELSALVKPAAEAIAKKMPDARIILVLTPCQYTSGKELEYVKTIHGITHTITAEAYKSWMLRGHKPNIEFRKKGVVLYLGGDLAHAALIAKRVRYPAIAYVQDHLGWIGFYHQFFVPDEEAHQRLDRRHLLRHKIEVVGNLMVDSVKDLPKWIPGSGIITFMPGSRDWQIQHTTPIYEKIISELRIQHPALKFQLVSSPFEPATEIPGVKTIHFEEAGNSDLVITIPGTNTARLAARGIPMLVIFPLDNLDVIPLEGLAHYICKTPVFGHKIKKSLADIMNKRTRFFALPNIKAGREIVEEIRGSINPKEAADKAIALLNDLPKRQKMSAELISAMGQSGAAERIAAEINRQFSL